MEGPAGDRLKEAQKLAGVMQEHLAEAGGIKAAYERFASDFQYGRYGEEIEKASLCAERLTEKLRRLTMESILEPGRQREYQERVIRSHWITVGYGNGILKVELPFLLPHRKSKYTDYIYQPLFLAMEKWCGEREKKGLEVPAFREAVVCFCHVYDKGKPEIRVRDHDNIEEKQVVDALGTFFLESDGGLYLDTYHTTVMGDGDWTEVFLMEKGRFGDWIKAFYEENGVSKNRSSRRGEKSTG